MITKRKMERYPEALVQERSAIFCRERACYLPDRTAWS
jgi:hypothetical protein